MRYTVDAPEVNETLTMIQRLCANPSLPNMKNYLGRVDVLEEATHETLRQIFDDVSSMTEEELDTFAAALNAESIDGLDDILLIEQSLDAYCFYPDVTTDEELGRYLVDGRYVNVSEEVERYVNFSMLGADYYVTLGGAYGPKGYAQRLTDLNPVFKAYIGSGMVEEQAIAFLPLSDRQSRKLAAQLSVPKLEDACVMKLCCASESRQDLEQMPYLEAPSVPEADSLARELNRIHKTDGAYLTFLAALEAEQIDTFAGALDIAKELDSYTRFTGDPEEYGRDALRRMGTPQCAIDSVEGYDEMRQSVLKDLRAMNSYCLNHGGKLPNGNYGRSIYGYVAETERYRYCLRCIPYKGDYNAYLTCYDKQIQGMNRAQQQAVPDMMMGGIT